MSTTPHPRARTRAHTNTRARPRAQVTAATLFEATLRMKQQWWLIAYPLGLMYAAFALLTVF